MKLKNIQITAFSCVLFQASSILAYDVTTHTVMTFEAVNQSTLTSDPKSSAVIKRLGIKPVAEPLGRRYIDIGATLTSRSRDDFERGVMRQVDDGLKVINPAAKLPDGYSLTGWLMRGAIREDDNSVETPNSDEPGGVFSRVFGHFYDPHNDRGLTFLGLTQGGRSVDWALTPGTTADSRQNHFKITDAREAMWRALTLKGLQNGALIDLPPSTNPQGYDSLAEQYQDERNAYWATTFRALGDVVHLVQDTAQPQHTRNDAHSGVGCFNRLDPDATCHGGHDSFFEKYIKARTLNAPTFSRVDRSKLV